MFLNYHIFIITSALWTLDSLCSLCKENENMQRQQTFTVETSQSHSLKPFNENCMIRITNFEETKRSLEQWAK